MNIFTRLFGNKEKSVYWIDHPYTKNLSRYFSILLWEAKNLKRKRERVGRSADYWQGRIDLCEELLRNVSHIGWPYTANAIKCFRDWCPVCYSTGNRECNIEKHGEKNVV